MQGRLNKLLMFSMVAVFSQPANAAGKAELPRLSALVAEGAKVSALVVDLSTSQPISELGSRNRLTPASITKLALGAAALETMGSEHTYKTRILATSSKRNGVLDGDLVLVGSGDPYLTNERLWFLATDVARAGIRHVRGDLVLDTAAFGPIVRDENRRAGQNASSHAYDSPLSAAAVNFSVMALVAAPGDAPGQGARLGLEPFTLPTAKVVGQVGTTAGKGGSKISASRVRGQGWDEIRATGNISFEDFPQRIYRSVSDADEYSGSVIRAFLEHAGVKIDGKVVVSRQHPRGRLLPVAEVEGFPLDWQLRGLMKVSNNFIGDMLTLGLDLDPSGQRGATLAGGAKRLEDYVRTAVAQSPWAAADGEPLHLDSGSGLTPENRLSARDMVAVLQRMYANTREFPSFLSSLPIPGAEGTVKRRFSEAREAHLKSSIRAKTGTLTQPYDAVGFAGYYRGPRGSWSAFAIIVNGTRARPAIGVDRIRDAIDSDLATVFPSSEIGSK